MAAPITLSTTVSASREAVFEALTQQDGLASFWTSDSKAVPNVGSVAVFSFGPARLEMRVDELSFGERVAWTCVNDFPMEPYRWEGTKVSWTLGDHDQGVTKVLLEHGSWPAELPQRAVASTAFNWALILNALKAYAETGKADPVSGKRPVAAS